MKAGWSIVPLGEVIEPVERLETPIPGKPYRQVGVRLWGEGAYQREEIDGADTNYNTLNQVAKDDIIVNKIWARNGSVSVISEDLEGSYCSSEFPLFLPDKGELLPRWFFWITKTRWFWSACDQKSRGTSGKNRIKPSQFLEVEIPLPPLKEQRRIVARIDALAARIEEARRLREEVGRDMDSLLVAMAHRNDLDEKEKLAQGWRRVTLGEVLTQVSDPVDVEPDGEYPNLGIYSYARGLFRKAPIDGSNTSAKKLYRVKSGDFIYSRLFAFEGAYGYVSEEYDGSFVSNEYPTFRCDPDRILIEFLVAYFKSSVIWEETAGFAVGLGSRRKRVKPEALLGHEIWLPPIEWQQKIKATDERLSSVKQDRDAAALQLDALLPAILDQAFKGEL